MAEIKKARELKQKKKEEEAYEEQRQIKNYYESLELESKIKYDLQVDKAAINNKLNIKSHIIEL